MKPTTPAAVRLPQMRLDFAPQDIPEHVLKIMAMASCGLTEKILREPGGRERESFSLDRSDDKKTKGKGLI